MQFFNRKYFINVWNQEAGEKYASSKKSYAPLRIVWFLFFSTDSSGIRFSFHTYIFPFYSALKLL